MDTKATAIAMRPTSQERNSPDRISELTRTLALVRPVGMNDDMASDWIAAAAAEVRHMGDTQFRSGCAKARRECTHHAQIIPSILGVEAGFDSAAAFIGDWHRAVAEHQGRVKQLADKTGTQKLIEGAARKLSAHR